MSKKFFTPIDYVGVSASAFTDNSLVSKLFVIDQIANSNTGTSGWATNAAHSYLSDTATNATLLNSNNAAFYLNRTNHTGTQTSSTISDLTTTISTTITSGTSGYSSYALSTADTSSNGITKTGNNFVLGGALTTDTFITSSNNHSLILGSSGGNELTALTTNISGAITLNYGTINLNSSFGGGGIVFGSDAVNYSGSLISHTSNSAYNSGVLVDLNRTHSNQAQTFGIRLQQTHLYDKNFGVVGPNMNIISNAYSTNNDVYAGKFLAQQTGAFSVAPTYGVYSEAYSGTAGLAYSFYGQAGDVYISGKTGIGTIPSAKLHVKGIGTSSGELFKLDDNSSINRFLISDNGTLYANAGTAGQSSFYLTTSGTTVNKVLKYNSNISSQYDNRSLVDKEYVDSAVSGVSGSSVNSGTSGWATNAAFAYTTPLTFSNGITKTVNDVTLGGSLTTATTITTGDFGLTINASASTSGYGLKYAADYSSQFTNRSIVDKAYVLSQVYNRVVSSVSTNTAAGAATKTDYIYFASSTIAITLPTAVGNSNKYTVKNIGVGTITINTTNSETIDGNSSVTISTTNNSLDFISDGVNWRLI